MAARTRSRAAGSVIVRQRRAPAAAIRRDDDDWALGGYAGLSLGAALTSRLELSIGAEARFPHKGIRFDDGVVSGKIELAKWSTFAALSLKF